MDALDRARQTRRAIELYATGTTDAQAAEIPTLFPVWRAGEAVKQGDRRYYPPTGKLYKVREGQGHTTQADWPPDMAASLWEVVDVAHAGTLDDPIPAAANMEYFSGKHYVEAGIIYLCTRGTEQPIAQLPSTLVGVYFEVMEVG
jgi:hypothetical protein